MTHLKTTFIPGGTVEAAGLDHVWIVLTKDPKGVWAIDSVKNNAKAALARGEKVKEREGWESFVDRRSVDV